MKSKLFKLTIAAFVVMTIKVSAQATLGAAIVTETFENWTGSVPNNWEISPASTIASANVTKVTNSSTVTPVQSGNFSCKLVNTASSYTPGIMAGVTVAVTAAPVAYQISYYARGKGTISAEVTDGSAATTSANYSAANGQTVSGKGWHHFVQTVVAPTTTNNAQFCLKVKSTGTYTASGGVSITGIDVDSFVVQPYTPIPASLHDIQYTAASNGNSPFFGQFVSLTGGIVTDVILTSSTPSGYYVQTTGSHAWAAALVFDQTNVANVTIGDSVTFKCAVDEYFNMTELVQVTNFTKVSSGHSIASTQVNTQTIQDEQYEGILVNIQNATVQTYNANYGEGTIADVASGGVPCTFDFKAGFYSPNGTATTGSTGNPGYTPTAPYPSTIAYCVTGNVNYEFSAYSLVPRDSADIVKNCTSLSGIAKYNNSLNATMYPNPVTNQFNIQLPVAASKVSVSFTDVLGKEVLTNNNLSGSNISINDISLPAGVYVVKIVADGKTQVVKVIKQ
ncbi:MAG: T9SS type A sorting domain-containing protein [Bacteroidia bacterium]